MRSSCSLLVILLLFAPTTSGAPPVLPNYWIASFHGEFFGHQSGCEHRGVLYYNSELKLLRTDWMLGPFCPLVGNEFSGKLVINEGNNSIIRNYHVMEGSNAFRCEILPCSGWWTPDYLSHGTLLGVQELQYSLLGGVTVSQEVAVYNTTGQFISGYVLSYVSVKTQDLVRMDIYQGPYEVS